MKRVSVIVLLTVLALFLTSCYTTAEYDSLDEYRESMFKDHGHSSLELDHPNCILPYDTFIDDHPYIEGGYHLFEDDPLRIPYTHPSRSILWFEYTPDIYEEAKKSIDYIIERAEKSYHYDNFVFFVHKDLSGHQVFTPHWFTMVGYNDQTCAMLFLGFNSEGMSVAEVSEMMEPDFGIFLHTFWGDYYDFG